MADVEPFPFATLDELRERWPDFPNGADSHAVVQLDDASQFILDLVPSAAAVSPSTRRRVVCAVVRRSMEASDSEMAGFEQFQQTAGPFSMGGKPVNPSGDFYLTKAEKKALGFGKQSAFGVQIAEIGHIRHRPWCNLNFGANYCSCGSDIAGQPIYERGY